ncbi:SDR family NAD(P)-dependent oxidoreductase [Actinoallomurus acaciae]|uniref:SDR family NAD(P)-dependent oxidoreductase n=1 Tax=Actinoallomurus acaciae TaxID=502577 RepID=A0ABV5Y900_9ACTN
MSRFNGKVALVTGASGGVGRAIAYGLAAEGAAVGVVGRDTGALRETVSMVERAGGRALPIEADIGVGSDVEHAVAELVTSYGRLDLLAHAAGVFRTGAVTDLPEEQWDLLFTTNVKSCFLLGRHAIPHMRAAGGGAIVNVSSVFAFAAGPGSAGYAASKAAVVALTKMMALDHIADGIRVNCVAPGSMRTPLLENAVAGHDDPEEALAGIGRLHPLGRLIDPTETASLVLYLLSDDARAVVGSCFTIDGGRLAKLGSAT